MEILKNVHFLCSWLSMKLCIIYFEYNDIVFIHDVLTLLKVFTYYSALFAIYTGAGATKQFFQVHQGRNCPKPGTYLRLSEPSHLRLSEPWPTLGKQLAQGR